jgi:VWFA-related protein
MATKIGELHRLGLSLLLAGLLPMLVAGTLAAQQKPDEIPDAPSATRPLPPPEPVSPRPGADDTTAPDASSPSSSSSSTDNPDSSVNPGSKEMPRSAPDTTTSQPAPPPMPPVKTVPAGSVPKDSETGFTLPVTVNYVLVPVMVTDADGRLVGGLQSKDFSVLENGQPQRLRFFTSDPFPLSAAVVIDTGMPDVGLKKVQQSLSALQGAFSQFDEVSVYTYSTTVGRVSDYSTGLSKQVTVALDEVKAYSGVNNGPPVTSGPLGPGGPMINGLPIDTPATPISTPPRVSHVLNDAILFAARDLSKRERNRRKIIFVISDGFELGSAASYADTLKVLLTQNITVYAVGVEGAAIPVYDRLQRVHLPKTTKLMGYSDILPKYVNATGGGTVRGALTEADVERAYAQSIGDARNQYTLGYQSKPGIGGYREIEVQVKRAHVKVYAKRGYYPLPTPHQLPVTTSTQ